MHRYVRYCNNNVYGITKNWSAKTGHLGRESIHRNFQRDSELTNQLLLFMLKLNIVIFLAKSDTTFYRKLVYNMCSSILLLTNTNNWPSCIHQFHKNMELLFKRTTLKLPAIQEGRHKKFLVKLYAGVV